MSITTEPESFVETDDLADIPDRPNGKRKRAKKTDTPAPIAAAVESHTPSDRAEAMYIAMSDIVWTPLNPRKHFDPNDLAQLANSIRASGLLQPIIVRAVDHPKRKDCTGYEGYIGERRWRAHQLMGAEHIRAIVRNVDDVTVRRVAAIENLQRADLGPMEEARVYRDLMADDPHLTVGDVALLVSKDPSYVHRRLQLNRLPERAQKYVEDRILPFKAALELARVESADDVEQILKEHVDRNVERRWPIEAQNIARYCHATTRQLKHAPWSPKDADLVPEAGACVTCPKATANASTLFPDVEAKDNRCTDRACWMKKEVAFVNLRRGTVQKKAEKMGLATVAISAEWDRRRQYPEGSDVPLSRNFYTLIDDTTKVCPDTRLGVCVETHENYVGGMKLGDSPRVCVNKDCKIHRDGYSSSASGDRSRLEIKKKERKANAESDVRRAALDEALTKVKWPLTRATPNDITNLRVIAVWMLDRVFSDQPPAIARSLDLEYVAHKSPSHRGHKDVDSSDYQGGPRSYSGAMGALRVYIDKLDAPGLLSFMARLALFGETQTKGSTDPHAVPRLEAFATRHKVNIKAMREKRLALWAENEKERAAKRAAAEKRKKAREAKDAAKEAAKREKVEQAEA